jgi:hypothetical protein
MTDAAHSKCAQIGANRTIPSHSPEHTGPRALPRPNTNREDGSQERGQGAGPKRSAQAVRREAVAAQNQAFGSLFCAAQALLRVRLSAGCVSATCALTPPTLAGGPGGRHIAEARTADGLWEARTKNVMWWYGPRVEHPTRSRLCPDPNPRSPVPHDKKTHEHVRASVKPRKYLPSCVHRHSRAAEESRERLS